MPKDAFLSVDTWVFDLDHTLYPPSARLFDLIEVRMTAYVMQALGVDRATADHLRKHYWATHGTTLAGLMREHDVDPARYLTEVHDIPMDSLDPAPQLAAQIRALPGRKIVYTNGCAPYAERVLAARALGGVFDAIYGVEDADFLPKPDHAAFDTVFRKDGLAPQTAAMFEDDARNLKVPHAMGMRTVHVAETRGAGQHIHFHTDDLGDFLAKLL
ncbi:pyrimidine 5'-nucleotidase [Roseobacter sp.]|uniref:pyrimidine 5'-nucleotidase n=1 Tax=Roseobacter sp. TaxID=1907202 RepID=UPI003298EA15